MVKRYTVDWDNIGLGERNDCEIAAEIGCTRFAVLQQRRKRGIASCDHRRVLRALDAQIAAHIESTKQERSDDDAQVDVDESSNRK